MGCFKCAVKAKTRHILKVSLYISRFSAYSAIPLYIRVNNANFD